MKATRKIYVLYNVLAKLEPKLFIMYSFLCTLTLTNGIVILRESGVTYTFEGSYCITTSGVLVTWIIVETLVDVFVTVTALETGRTCFTAGGFIAHSVTVTTATIALTVLAPSSALASCNSTHGVETGTDGLVTAA